MCGSGWWGQEQLKLVLAESQNMPWGTLQDPRHGCAPPRCEAKTRTWRDLKVPWS